MPTITTNDEGQFYDDVGTLDEGSGVPPPPAIDMDLLRRVTTEPGDEFHAPLGAVPRLTNLWPLAQAITARRELATGT